MFFEVAKSHPYWTITILSFLVNIPCGYIRQRVPKFSGKWLFWIHASIPLIIFLRLSLHTSPWFIPVCIALAVLGQMGGAKWRSQRMTQEEIDHLKQIPDLNLSSPQLDDDKNVMIVLLNMGGPKTNADVKSFQEHLFTDPILIRFPLSFLLQKVFARLLITFRLKAVQKRYQLIGGGSPIYKSTENQVRALTDELRRRGRYFDVIYGFNYSPPFPEETMRTVKQKNKKYLLPLSLYPHYSKATTGSNLYYLKKAAQKEYPGLKFMKSASYFLHDGYIQAFVDRIYESVEGEGHLKDYYLVFSVHGLPLYFLVEGDPYPFQVAQTTAKVLHRLGRSQDWVICYQSAVGPLQWLKPSTDDILAALARKGIKKVLVVPISFVGDHIETSCEIDIEYRHLANKLGIKDSDVQSNRVSSSIYSSIGR